MEFNKELVRCEVYFENIQDHMDEEETFALVRKGGLGASDASVFMGLMTKFSKDTNTLIQEKQREEITDEERAIGKLVAVRKGRDLEDLILEKFSKLYGSEKPMKPRHMYKITEFPYLTVNFDGVLYEQDAYIPVECKFVTTYGDKNYDKTKAFKREEPDNSKYTHTPVMYNANDVVSMCEAYAAACGIPAYYYVQVQQQILALDSPYGYLAALHDKGWELIIYKIPRNDDVIRQIQIIGYKTWNKIQAGLSK